MAYIREGENPFARFCTPGLCGDGIIALTANALTPGQGFSPKNLMTLFDPKPPEELDPETEQIGLLTFIEMFMLHTACHALPQGQQGEAMFVKLLQQFGLPAYPDKPIEVTITPGGFDDKPPKRLMTRAEYAAYFQENL
jgi:hypothetical protein